MSRLLLAAVLTLSSLAFAQTPDEVAAWLRGIGAKVNSQAPTPELIAKAYSVSFDGKEKLVVADLARLKGIPKLREVGFTNKLATDEAVAAVVKAVPNLETIKIHYSGITDASFVELAKLPKLKEIVAFDTAITAAAMVSISKLASLQRIDVSNTKIGDEGLEALKGSNLTNLWFNGMKGVTRKGVAAIAAMPRLTNLVLQFAEINAEVEELTKSKTLKELTLMSSKVDDAGGVHLGKIKTLQNLFLWNTKMTDKTMDAISGLPLKVLYVTNTPITDAGMKSLSKIKTLETLWFDRTAVGDAGVAHFANHPKLRWFAADESKVTDAVVATLVTIPGMATFSARKTALTDAATKKLLEKFPKGRFSK